MGSSGSGSWPGALSRRDAVQRQSETKDAVSWNRSTHSIAVPKRWRNPDNPFIARPHKLQGLREARNEAVNRPGQRRTTLIAAVERLAGYQLAFVVEGHRVATGR